MSIEPTSSTVNEFILRLMWGLRNKLSYSDDSCYIVGMPLFVEGMSPDTLQISAGPLVNDTTIDGGQQGGGTQKRLSINLDFWHTCKMDMPRMSQEMLTEEAKGMNDWASRVRDALKMTTLGGTSLEPVRWDGETGFVWYAMELGVGRKTMTVSATYREALPTEFTLTSEDCRPRLPS